MPSFSIPSAVPVSSAPARAVFSAYSVPGPAEVYGTCLCETGSSALAPPDCGGFGYAPAQTEGRPVPLGFSSVFPDYGGRDLSALVLSGLPAGSRPGIFTDDGFRVLEDLKSSYTGDWIVPSVYADTLGFLPPSHYSGYVELHVLALPAAKEDPVLLREVPVRILPVMGGVNWTAKDVTGYEDQGIGGRNIFDLNLSAVFDDTDGSERIETITIAGLPDGWRVIAPDGGGHTYSGVWFYSRPHHKSGDSSADLAGLRLQLPEHESTDGRHMLNVSLLMEDNGNSHMLGSSWRMENKTFSIDVRPVADTPVLEFLHDVPVRTMIEDVVFEAGIMAMQPDPSQSLLIRIFDLPDGSSLGKMEDGRFSAFPALAPDADGIWTVPTDALEGLYISPPEHFSGFFAMGVEAASTEDRSLVSLVARRMLFDVRPVVDPVVLSVSDDFSSVDVSADGVLSLNPDLSIAMVDDDGSERPTILELTGVPEGWKPVGPNPFHDQGNGVWRYDIPDDGDTIRPGLRLEIPSSRIPDAPVSMGLRIYVQDVGGSSARAGVVGAWQNDALMVLFSTAEVGDACPDTGCDSHASSKGHHTMSVDPDRDLEAFFPPIGPGGWPGGWGWLFPLSPAPEVELSTPADDSTLNFYSFSDNMVWFPSPFGIGFPMQWDIS